MGKNLSNETKIVELVAAASHGTGALTTAILDTDGFENVTILIHHGAYGSATITGQTITSSAASNMAGATTISSPADRDSGDSDNIFCTEIVMKDNLRYLRYNGTIGTAAHVMSVTAILTGARRSEAVPGEGVPGASGSQFEASV